MLRTLLAVAIAAICALVIVGSVPPPAPAVAAAQPAAPTAAAANQPAVATERIADIDTGNLRNAGCTQAWPYYEQSCLRDARRQNGSARAVRVVAGKPVAGRLAQAQR